jgi:serine/threonine protein kinase
LQFKNLPVDHHRVKAQGGQSSFNIKEHVKSLSTADLIGPSENECPFVVKIADLGFARKLEEDSLTATHCGTPLLMAP